MGAFTFVHNNKRTAKEGGDEFVGLRTSGKSEKVSIAVL